MRVLYGFYRPDEGEILLDGEPVTIASPADAIAHGIGMIHQHFMLVNTLTVAENVALGLPLLARAADRPGRRLRTDPRALGALRARGRPRRGHLAALGRRAAAGRDHQGALPDVSLLILDEPTAVLTPQEVDDLFAVLRQMVADGRGLVFISHKIREVLELSDRITVLRAGRKIGTVLPTDVTPHALAEMMVGHALASEELAAGDRRSREARLAVARPARDGRPRHARPCAGSTSRCTRARSSRSPASRGTASASSPRRSPACGRRPPARSGSSGAELAGRHPAEIRRGRARLRPRGADARRRRPRLHASRRTCS